MADGLLGRLTGATERELREEVAELEAERERLEDRLEAERERRADAVSARQDAEERVNRLEDRIADLEGQLERAGDEAGGPHRRGAEALRGERLARVLDRLESVEAPDEGALTAMVDGDVPLAVREAFGERTLLVERAAPCLALTDDAGLVAATLEPPLTPEPFCAWDDRFRLDRAWFEPTGEHAVALVRSDLFAFGAYEGTERVEFEGFDSDVKGKHSKGGYSQGRFERRRDAQIDEHLERCEAVLDERAPERLIVVGEGTLLGEFADRAAATAAVDATGDPEPALDHAVEDFWTTRLTLV
ncbi:MAG: Vms1/Ankzf1 family peptidyl-tRNA hydrolase [Halobacteriales archaeon]|nr:Vms1/Ankzf1 family peptidyl-tRNA hydrolase [Halobacteriales archaeon]